MPAINLNLAVCLFKWLWSSCFLSPAMSHLLTFSRELAQEAGGILLLELMALCCPSYLKYLLWIHFYCWQLTEIPVQKLLVTVISIYLRNSIVNTPKSGQNWLLSWITDFPTYSLISLSFLPSPQQYCVNMAALKNGKSCLSTHSMPS